MNREGSLSSPITVGELLGTIEAEKRETIQGNILLRNKQHSKGDILGDDFLGASDLGNQLGSQEPLETNLGSPLATLLPAKI